MPPPVPAEAKREKTPPLPPPAPVAAEVAPRQAEPSPVLSEVPPQVYQSWPMDDDPIDPASIGLRRSIVPASLASAAQRVRASLLPPGRAAEVRGILVTAAIATLRGLRTVLDKLTDLTIKLELRLRD